MKDNKYIPNSNKIEELANVFKIFGDSTRIRILYSIYENEFCVYDIANNINMTQSAVSHQLSILKNARLVKSRKDGKTVFYSLDDSHIQSILNVGLDHIEEKEKLYE